MRNATEQWWFWGGEAGAEADTSVRAAKRALRMHCDHLVTERAQRRRRAGAPRGGSHKPHLQDADVVVHQGEVRHRVDLEVVRGPRVLEVVRDGGEEQAEDVDVLEARPEGALEQEHPRLVEDGEGVPGGIQRERGTQRALPQRTGGRLARAR